MAGRRDIAFIDPARSAAAPLAEMLALNERHKTQTSPLDAARLAALLDASSLARATPDGAAFLIAFDEGSDYDSPNFLWFRNRLERFLYVDRIVVAESLRGRGIARALYGEAFAAAALAGRDRVVCEVNLVPPNRGSDAFHAALGFAEVGRGAPAPGKVVRYLAREVAKRETTS
ncbi:GNAT family N-acetyltransferase [Limibaculum sp. FT325]|uniref:GNAT family N-acetyltransferase n=1 Tax=Thermohalobaculum sediminis TaxID=2939436 RepID=UPI0020BE47D0|nr:GNAT family N-acetyltransferase [Limibaculum sediminis]MCL5775516.1 GNAT family N-acetyltransferase [Limibaculum sediminis]